jgi:hypothetical protein
MPYFRSRFLNGLRDELWLTMTCQKMTLFHLLSMSIPASGLGIGIASGMKAHAISAIIMRGGIGLAVGIVIAWLLPRCLWKMLWLLSDRRWLLQPEPPPAVPVISWDEFLARTKAKDRDQWWHAGISIGGFFAGVVGFNLLFSCLKRMNAPDWIAFVAFMSLIGSIIGFLVLERTFYTRLVNKHRLACPNCGTEIAGVGRCWHCGAAVVEDAASS